MRMLVLVLAACSTDPGSVATQNGRCTALEGRTFASVNQGECGLGPNGPVLCTWHISFTPNNATSSNFSWQHSDYGVDGAVTCTGGMLASMTTSGSYTGSYDEATQQLIWDGQPYAPM